MSNKVPRITLLFWVLKITATTLGETGGDMLSMTLNVGYAVSSLILLSLFIPVVAAQLVAKRYHPLLYWSVILATSTSGTTMSDFMDRSLGLGYMLGSALLLTLLLLTLGLWRWRVGTLSVQEIRSPRVEMLYWTAILFSNTLGTALGDFLADDSGLGFLGGALVVGGALAVLAALYYWTQLSRVFLFWAAFILTRPFGATFGDVLSKPLEKGGLGFGTIGSSAVLAGILLVGLLYAHTRENRERRLPGTLSAA